jgi:hypothetical protein
MKLIADTNVPLPAHNISDDELVRHVEHYFPDIQGPLKMLLERFTFYAGNKDEMDKMDERSDEIIEREEFLANASKLTFAQKCPNCSSVLRVELAQNS